MTIEEIERRLPNGFHDSNIKTISIDYVMQLAKFNLEVNMGTPDVRDKEPEEIYRDGILTVSELLFCVIEPPDPQYPYKDTKGLWITSSGPIEAAKLPIKVYEVIPEGLFDHYFFINDWNSFIYLAAKNAQFDWL